MAKYLRVNPDNGVSLDDENDPLKILARATALYQNTNPVTVNPNYLHGERQIEYDPRRTKDLVNTSDIQGRSPLYNYFDNTPQEIFNSAKPQVLPPSQPDQSAVSALKGYAKPNVYEQMRSLGFVSPRQAAEEMSASEDEYDRKAKSLALGSAIGPILAAIKGATDGTGSAGVIEANSLAAMPGISAIHDIGQQRTGQSALARKNYDAQVKEFYDSLFKVEGMNQRDREDYLKAVATDKEHESKMAAAQRKVYEDTNKPREAYIGGQGGLYTKAQIDQAQAEGRQVVFPSTANAQMTIEAGNSRHDEDIALRKEELKIKKGESNEKYIERLETRELNMRTDAILMRNSSPTRRDPNIVEKGDALMAQADSLKAEIDAIKNPQKHNTSGRNYSSSSGAISGKTASGATFTVRKK